MTRGRCLAWAIPALASLAIAMLATPTFIRPPILFVWNASASVPLGLYRVQAVERVAVGDLVVVEPPPALAEFLAARRYIGAGVPLMKRVVALSGQTVCRAGDLVTVDGTAMALARERDRLGRPLPTWSGCRTLTDSDVFLLNPDEPASLDGRYFGPLPRASVIGRAVPLWTHEER